jgi:hypothetical protein
VVADFGGLTTVEVSRLVSRLLIVAVVGIGITTTYLASAGVIAASFGALAIPCALTVLGLVWYNFQIGDYENPDELEKFRSDAARMSFENVINAYGWNDVLRFGILTPDLFAKKYLETLEGKTLLQVIAYYEKTQREISRSSTHKFRYQIPSPRESTKLWIEETKNKTFEQILSDYPLDKLELYGIVDEKELNCIKNLKLNYEALKRERDTKSEEFNKVFARNTLLFKNTYDAKCAQANEQYNQNEAIRGLQAAELHYARQRQLAQEERIKANAEANTCFEQEIAPFTKGGVTAYNYLSQEEKVRYDEAKGRLERAKNQAETLLRLRIEKIHADGLERSIYYNREKARLTEELNRALAEAKRVYDQEVNEHQLTKDGKLGPIEASFRSSVNDVNSRYQAYLTIIKCQH